MQPLFENVFMLEGEVGGRPLQLMYLRGNRASLLLDTGCTGDPQQFIAPQIREAGGDPSELTWIVNTHPDLDHVGGNYAMKQIAARAFLACGDADRALCSDPDVLFSLRYDAYRADHGIYYGDEQARWMREQSGTRQPIDVTFVGGEHIRLSDDWEVEIVALPGHAKGHLGVLDAKNQALYGGDAIHGSVYLGLDGTPRLCPTYADVDDYLNTIRFIEHLPITTYVGCHWNVKRDGAIKDFCAESREFVLRADHLLQDLLRTRQTLRDICLTLAPQLGDWEHTPALDLELVYALYGNVSRLVERGIAVSRRNAEGKLEYALS
jgi:glyoxylase-like metal-dependent hydrolase (beta-lactamase superfamily II)